MVSTHDLAARIRQAGADSLALFAQAADPAAPPKPKYKRPSLAVAYAAPRNKTEQKLAEIWQEVLGIEQVGVHDDFFELGGDSLLITQIHSRLAADVSIARLLQYPTIAGLAELLDQRPGEEQAMLRKVQDHASQQKEALRRRKQAIQGMRKAHV